MPLPPPSLTDFGFPDLRTTPLDGDGLLAIGGDLEPERLLAAYANGVFPWFNSDSDDILWWCPDPRGVIEPAQFQPSASLRKTLRRSLRLATDPHTPSSGFEFRIDTAFPEVISACAETPRPGQSGTWITPKMRAAYIELHRAGYAHSLETWQDGALVGGLYGVSLGNLFFGESMFSHARDASKCAFAVLCAQLTDWNFDLIDCQMMNAHLASLGVSEEPRDSFLNRLAANDLSATRRGPWHLAPIQELLAVWAPRVDADAERVLRRAC